MVAEKFQVHPVMTLGEHRRFSINKPKEQTGTVSHTCGLSDIDFNSHVNNKSYITIAEATLSEDFKKSHLLRKMSISFKRETFLGDTLNCTTSDTDQSGTYVHRLTKDGAPVCDIETVWSIRDSNP